MTWPWFFGALGFSLACAIIGWKKSPKCEPELEEPEEMFWSKEYKQMYEEAVRYAEQLYQKK